MDERKKVILGSLLLTILIFAIGGLVNHFFDAIRIATIVGVIQDHELDSDAYQVERLFTQNFGGEACQVMDARISTLKKEIRKVGEDLGSYSRFSFFRKKDYDYLKRKYFLLELHFLAFIKQLNEECAHPYVPVLFFYSIDDEASERQGFILEELSKEYDQQLVVLSIDKDYRDEPLVDVLLKSYNVSSAPSLVIDGQLHEGLMYTGVLNASLRKFLVQVDQNANGVDFSFTPKAAGLNMSQFVNEMKVIANNESQSSFARGDAKLIAGRLEQNDSEICESLQWYDRVVPSSDEEQAIVYETSASIGCGRQRSVFLHAAASSWKKVGNLYRAKLLEDLASGKQVKLVFDPIAINANTTVISGYRSPILPNLSRSNKSEVVIGKSQLVINGSSVLLSQDDRVFRDWLGGQLADPYGPTLLTTFSERFTYNDSELLAERGWHEGGRIKELKKTNATHRVAVGTLAARFGTRWFGVDDAGVFRFEIPNDKILYPTTRFLRSDLAVVIDTHGINMLVEQALRERVSTVIGCCDHPGKIYAANYLSDRGISVICFTDKYLYLALGHNVTALGSPPLMVSQNEAIVGARPMQITSGDRIVAMNATPNAYGLWYYQTPASYMDALSEGVNLNVTYVSVDGFGQMNKVVAKAKEINASVIAARVFNSRDYSALKQWLDEDVSRRVILFHSASYPYGVKLLEEYPLRSSFDDPNPIIK